MSAPERLPRAKHERIEAIDGLGLAAFIYSGGRFLQPIGPHRAEDLRLSGALFQAEDGASFCVGIVDLRAELDQEGFEVALFLDGVETTREMVAAGDPLYRTPLNDPRRMILIDGVREEESAVKTFAFSKTDIIDSDDDVGGTGIRDQEAHRQVGIIELRICRLENLKHIGPVPPPASPPRQFVKAPEDGFRFLSEISATVSGQVEERPIISYRYGDRVDTLDDPYYTFRLRYERKERSERRAYGLPEGGGQLGKRNRSESLMAPPGEEGGNRRRRLDSSGSASTTSTEIVDSDEEGV